MEESGDGVDYSNFINSMLSGWSTYVMETMELK